MFESEEGKFRMSSCDSGELHASASILEIKNPLTKNKGFLETPFSPFSNKKVRRSSTTFPYALTWQKKDED